VSKTPILDCEEPVPAVRVKRRYRYCRRGVLAGGAVGLYLAFAGRPLPNPAESPLYLMLGCLLAFYIAVLVHELGHLIAGIASDFEFHGIGVGLFSLNKVARGFRLRIVPRRIVTGGYTDMAPRQAEALVGRLIRLTAGGPIATVLLLIVTLLLPWSFLIGCLLVVDLLLTFSALVPYAVQGHTSDAKKVLILARRGPDSDRLAAIVYLLALDARGIELRDWPCELLEKATATTADTTFRGVELGLRYLVALDSGDAEAIAGALEQALAWSHEVSSEARRAWFANASYFQGIFRNNASLASAWLRRAYNVRGAVSRKAWDSRPLAAIAFAEGKYAEAREYLKRYIADLDLQALSGMTAAERARMVSLMNQASALSDR
jgi:Peptidase family M50